MIRPLFLFEGMSLGEISSRLTDISHKTDGGMKEGVDQKYRDQKCISNMDDTATEDSVEECIKKMLEYGLFVMNNQKKEHSRFRFVGGFDIALGENTITCYSFPKYFRNADVTRINTDAMSLIMKVIAKTGKIYDYDLESVRFTGCGYSERARRVDVLKLARWIVNDYCTNGIFTMRSRRTVRERKGTVKWTRTVTSIIPVIDGNSVVYPETYRSIAFRDDSDLISEIHRTAVKEAIKILKKFGEKNSVFEPETKLQLEGKLAKYIGVIRKHQNNVFYDRDVRLMRALEAWADGCSHYYDKPVGTVSFELVWEKCVHRVFGNVSDSFSFGSPEYILGKKNRHYQVDNDSIPDVINIFRDGNAIKFVLLDAKYYLGSLEKDKRYSRSSLKKECGGWILDVPGYKDIAKQVDYYRTLKDEYGIPEGINAFVLPWYDMPGYEDISSDSEYKEREHDSYTYRWIGYASKGSVEKDDEICKIIQRLSSKNTDIKLPVEKDMKDDNKERRVQLIQIWPEWLYKRVLCEKKLTHEELVEFYEFLVERLVGENDEMGKVVKKDE
ncbi:MAG: LlaJI family restriction endonuclease [Coprococcus eutactus]